MDISAVLIRDLDRLLGDPDSTTPDAVDALAELQSAVRMIVPSYLGCRLALVFESVVVTLTGTGDRDRVEEVGSTLLVPLVWLESRRRPGELVFYAKDRGALVGLAAQLGFAFQLETDEVKLDGAFDTVPLVPGVTGLDDLATINRAVGTLMADGMESAAAIGQLRRTAEINGTLMIIEASQVLARHATADGPAASQIHPQRRGRFTPSEVRLQQVMNQQGLSATNRHPARLPGYVQK